MKLLFGTNNPSKLRELSQLLDQLDGRRFEILGMKAAGLVLDVVEDRDSFEGNARKKATELALAAKLPTLADDSGLEVDALDGAPGIYSARYSGTHGDHVANNRKLLRELEAHADRRARFRCVLALAAATGEVLHVADGRCEGRIATALRGEGGFGYDPLFLPDATPGRTMAELSPEEKNAISHRGQAARAMAEWIRSTRL